MWDGKADDGTPVAAGPYVVHIEGAREHGGYEVVSEQFAYGGAAFAKDVAGNGELQNVKLAFKPK